MKKNASAIIIPDIDDSSAVNAKTVVFQSSNEQDEILKMSIDELFTEFGEDLNFVNGDED